jgi:hypothetical protein
MKVRFQADADLNEILVKVVAYARLRAFPPQAVIGPAFMPGWRGR